MRAAGPPTGPPIGAKTRIGPLPPRQAPSHDSSVNRRHLRFNSGIVRRAGWPTIDFGSKANAIALPPSPQAPLFIFRDAIHEAADRIERRAPEEYRGGDREVELFDVALVLKREHALERFVRRHPPRIINQDVDAPTSEIRQAQFGETLLEPALIRSTVAVDERDRFAPRRAHPRVAGRPGAALSDLDDPAARPTMRRTASSPRELPLSATMISVRSPRKLCACSNPKQASKLL
jgi:hypothetical protein